MELGNHIKTLRHQRGITQETLAAALGVSAQAVSKWENQAAAPDIQLLPAISTYFGVTIDELFALSDETRMERIQNMLWDERDLDSAVAAREAAFLLEKGEREPSNSRVYELLADMENHIARSHRRKAEGYAKEALARNPKARDAFGELREAMGIRSEWYFSSHHLFIDWCKAFAGKHPDPKGIYIELMDALLEDGRVAEAREYCEKLAAVDHTYRTPHYQGIIAWKAGDWDGAMEIWEQMCRDFPEDWLTWASMGDVMAESGHYAEAVEYHEKSKQFLPRPRYVDPWEAIARLRELMGDIPGAIASLEEEIAVTAEDWDTTSGEMVDAVRREIERLKEKQKAEG